MNVIKYDFKEISNYGYFEGILKKNQVKYEKKGSVKVEFDSWDLFLYTKKNGDEVVMCTNAGGMVDDYIEECIIIKLENDFDETLLTDTISNYLKKPVHITRVMTFAEATERWGLADSTLRKLVTTDKLQEGIDYRKSGKVWLITEEAMKRVYGEEKNK
ncbi:helix-turn-helix domain-containing protein [Clostridium sp.]|uniref:helix-turn-helix domain-containing protein n=1 Tax=Clostridium sp. TaxID=1506 RepID=UPI003216E7F1